MLARASLVALGCFLAPASAEAHRLEIEDLFGFMLLNMLPGEVGIDGRMGQGSRESLRVLVGFPYQLPLERRSAFSGVSHRAVVAVQLATAPSDAIVRGRLGYRFVPGADRLILGGGTTLDGASGFSIYGEFGGREFFVKKETFPANFNVIFRFERSLVKDEAVRGAVMVGWAFY